MIYATQKQFGEKITVISGSLNDVKRVKGESSAKELTEFLAVNDLKFTLFSPLIHTWPKAFFSDAKTVTLPRS